MVIVVRSAFHEGSKYYPPFVSDIFCINLLLRVQLNLLSNIYILEYDMIDMSEGADANKTKELHRRIICNYYYSLEVSFRFQAKKCDVCYDLMQKVVSFNSVAIVSIKSL